MPVCPKCYNTRINESSDGTVKQCDYCGGRGFVEHTSEEVQSFRPESWHADALEIYQYYSDGFLPTGQSIADMPEVAVVSIRHLKAVSGVNQYLEQKTIKDQAAKAAKAGKR